MKHPFFGISVLALISALLLSSCSKDEYIPVQVSKKTLNIEIECVGTKGENRLADKAFTDKIKIEGENSHSNLKRHEVVERPTRSHGYVENDNQVWQAKGITQLFC